LIVARRNYLAVIYLLFMRHGAKQMATFYRVIRFFLEEGIIYCLRNLSVCIKVMKLMIGNE
jgi:hypothetical protein